MLDLKADADLNFQGQNDVFTKFSKTNFIKGRKAKLHKQLNPYSKQENDMQMQNPTTEQNKLDEKALEDLQEFVLPSLEKVNFDSVNGEEFLSKHWIEIMEVLYKLVSDIFLRIGNIQVSDEVLKLFTHIQNCSNKNIVKYIHERLFSKQKYSLDQYWFKNKDRIETLEKQKNDLKKEVMEVQELLMAMSNNSQSISTLQQKSRQQSIDGEETNVLPSSRNQDSDLKNNDTAEFGLKKKKESEVMSDLIMNATSKIQTMRSKHEESLANNLGESKQEPTKEYEERSPNRKKSSTLRNIESNTDDKKTTNFNRTISKVSNSKMMTSQSQHNFLRAGKMKIKEQLQIKQELKDLEKDNLDLHTKIDEMTKASVRVKSVLSQRIVYLEDKVK